MFLSAGTGYLTACFAIMVGPQGRAVGVEHIPELVNLSIKNIGKSAAAPLLKEGSLSMHVGGTSLNQLILFLKETKCSFIAQEKVGDGYLSSHKGTITSDFHTQTYMHITQLVF